ncbi:hypothetical protein CL628_02155 [bacterium]|nr:hypothetical protein [bacterium]
MAKHVWKWCLVLAVLFSGLQSARAEDLFLDESWNVDLTVTHLNEHAYLRVMRKYNFADLREARLESLNECLAAMQKAELLMPNTDEFTEIPDDVTRLEGAWKSVDGLHSVTIHCDIGKDSKVPKTLTVTANCKVSRFERPTRMLKLRNGQLTVEVNLSEFALHGVEWGQGEDAKRVPDTVSTFDSSVAVSGRLDEQSLAAVIAVDRLVDPVLSGGAFGWNLFDCRNKTAPNNQLFVKHGLHVRTDLTGERPGHFTYLIRAPSQEPTNTWLQVGNEGWPLHLQQTHQVGRTKVSNSAVKTFLHVTLTGK